MKDVSCRHCGSTDVYWEAVPGGQYRLFDKETNKRHFCTAFQTKVVNKYPSPEILLNTFHNEFMKLVRGDFPIEPEDIPMLLEKAKTNTLLRLI